MNLRSALALGLVLALALAVLPAAAGKSGKPGGGGASSKDLTLVGETGDNRPVATFTEAFFTDLAFQDDYAYQGTWNGGFRIVDISKPWRPKPVAEVDCGTFQGDIGVYGDLVFRSIDTPVAAATPEETCDAPRRPRASRASRSSRWTSRGGQAPTTWWRRWPRTAARTRIRSCRIRRTTACSCTSRRARPRRRTTTTRSGGTSARTSTTSSRSSRCRSTLRRTPR